MPEPMEKLLRKIDTISALILLVLVFLYFISGYGMTKNIIDQKTATLLHEEYLPIPTIIFFVIHSSLGIRILLKRWGLAKDKLITILTVLTFLIIFTILIYFELIKT